jgi:hypothetical protein
MAGSTVVSSPSVSPRRSDEKESQKPVLTAYGNPPACIDRDTSC